MRVLVVIAALLVSVPLSFSEDLPLQQVGRIPLPDVTGRIDHMDVDLANQRLFIAALGNNSLEVVDLRAGRRTRSIPRLAEPQGVIFATESGRLVVANGGDGACLVFDADTLDLITRIELHDDADNLRYEGADRKLYVGYGNGAIGIIDANYKLVGNIALPGHPEAFAISREEGKIFVNVPAAEAVVVADINKRQVVDTWKLHDARSNFPMALDEAAHLLFVGARSPSRLLGFDTRSGKVVVTFPLDGDPDDIFIDFQRHRIYVSCGEGYLDVVEWTGSGHYQVLTRIPTAPGARTSLFVPALGRLFLAVPPRGQQEAGIWVYAVQSEASAKGQLPAASEVEPSY